MVCSFIRCVVGVIVWWVFLVFWICGRLIVFGLLRLCLLLIWLIVRLCVGLWLEFWCFLLLLLSSRLLGVDVVVEFGLVFMERIFIIFWLLLLGGVFGSLKGWVWLLVLWCFGFWSFWVFGMLGWSGWMIFCREVRRLLEFFWSWVVILWICVMLLLV